MQWSFYDLDTKYISWIVWNELGIAGEDKCEGRGENELATFSPKSFRDIIKEEEELPLEIYLLSF